MNNITLVIGASIFTIIALAVLTPTSQAYGHIIERKMLQSAPLRLDNEQFSETQIAVGQNITVSVELRSKINSNIIIQPLPLLQSSEGLPISVLDNYGDFQYDANVWEVVSVSEEKILLHGGETRQFIYTIKALKMGSYHIDSAFEYVVDSPSFPKELSLAVSRGNAVVVTQDSMSTHTMHSPTASGNYLVELSWHQTHQQDSNTSSLSFLISIEDAAGFPQDTATYDFVLRNASTNMVVERFLNQQVNELGSARQNVTTGGSTPDGIIVDVIIRSAGRLPVLLDDRATFEIIVVPEFGSLHLVVAASVVSAMVLLSRSKLRLRYG